MSTPFEYSIGETIKVCLDVKKGDMDDIADVVAHLRKTHGSTRLVSPDAPLAAVFEVLPREEGWDLVIDAQTSATLTPGQYLTDAKLTLDGGDVIITTPLPIHLVPAVTRS